MWGSNQGSAGFVCQSTLRIDSFAWSVSWSPDGAKFAAGSDDGEVRIFDSFIDSACIGASLDPTIPTEGGALLAL